MKVKNILIAVLCFFSIIACKQKKENYLTKNWRQQTSDENCKIAYTKKEGEGYVIDYQLYKKNKNKEELPNKWVSLKCSIDNLSLIKKYPLVLRIKAESTDFLELKFIDKNKSVFGLKTALKEQFNGYTNLVMYSNNIEYMWGGKDDIMDELEDFEIVISGKGQGKIHLESLYFDATKPKSELPILGPVLDSLYNLEGFGFKQRRDSVLIPRDPLVLEYLKVIQDVSSKDKSLLPSQEDNEVSMFNNALVAMAFIVEGEKERAERILDYYDNARIKDNDILDLQNFYYKGEARGYYQYTNLRDDNVNKANYQLRNSDRWMGDNVWLTIAFLHYQKKYKSKKYANAVEDLKKLLKSWYIELDKNEGGYLGHGWRQADNKLHEDFGHKEGNIDAYALFQLLEEYDYANNIRIWLDKKLLGKNLPLDLYTWRTLAYGKEYNDLLDIPEFDFRYRKTVNINGKKVMGFYHGPDINTDNIWLDGTGHIACAYISYGDKYRGYFYANQLDKFIIERKINGRVTHAIPYTFNKKGGYEWVDVSKGFVSVAAWYIFAKNEFNPLDINIKD